MTTLHHRPPQLMTARFDICNPFFLSSSVTVTFHMDSSSISLFGKVKKKTISCSDYRCDKIPFSSQKHDIHRILQSMSRTQWIGRTVLQWKSVQQSQDKRDHLLFLMSALIIHCVC